MGALEDAQRERRMRERDRQIEAEIKRREAHRSPAQRVKQAGSVALSAGKKLYTRAKPVLSAAVAAADKATRPAPRKRSPRKAASRKAPARRQKVKKTRKRRSPRKTGDFGWF